SLDKITAEYLEEQLGGGKPVAVAETPSAAEPVVIVSAPPEPFPTTPQVEILTPTPMAVESRPTLSSAEAPTEVVEGKAMPMPPAEIAPAEPPSPPRPAIGEKIGFIHLPQKPVPKTSPKVAPVRPAPLAGPVRAPERPGAAPASQRPAAK
ncbi:MAG: hypothetical protein DME18_15690, partial [Verrucomicrobia bacterium]